ncbi:hypothetical protein [Campylobacter sp. LR185c]|nr:hypothetical protein [Campylobacter sp. LR185c]
MSIHFIFCNQKLSKKLFDSDLLSNIQGRIGLKVTDRDEARMAGI